ncbi:MAG: hypothetical protein LBL46_00410 [Rickettsiales bacterium]|jgi:hypothetical protein|nr:hypothetical protein [Rickettsiales bacterium]
MKKFNLQSAKFNCGARKRICAFGRLSLNFAICTLLIGGAEGAKLCAANPDSWACDAGRFTWAYGIGCDNSTADNGTNDFATRCGIVYAVGEARKTNVSCAPYTNQTSANPGANGSGNWVWCRIAGKKNWVCFNNDTGGTNAAHMCAIQMGLYGTMLSVN